MYFMLPQNHQRRSIERECSEENESRCCREAIHINVTEMGWDNWFIHPSAFTFYYCHGSCPAVPATGRTYNGSEYTKMKQVIYLLEYKTSISLLPCSICFPEEELTMVVVISLLSMLGICQMGVM